MYGKKESLFACVCERKRNLLCSPAVILSKNKTNTLPLPSNHPPCRANIQAKLHSATSPSPCLSLSLSHSHRGKGGCIIHPLKRSQQSDPERRRADCRNTCTHTMRFLWLTMSYNRPLAKNTKTNSRRRKPQKIPPLRHQTETRHSQPLNPLKTAVTRAVTTGRNQHPPPSACAYSLC